MSHQYWSNIWKRSRFDKKINSYTARKHSKFIQFCYKRHKRLSLYNWVIACLERNITLISHRHTYVMPTSNEKKSRLVFLRGYLQKIHIKQPYHLFSFQLWRISRICSVGIAFGSGGRCDSFQRIHKYKTACNERFGWRSTCTPRTWIRRSDGQRMARYTLHNQWSFLGCRTNKPREAATRTWFFF